MDHVDRRDARGEEVVHTHDDTGVAVGGNLDKGKGKDSSFLTDTSIGGGNNDAVPAPIQSAGNLGLRRDFASAGVFEAQQPDQNANYTKQIPRSASSGFQQDEVRCLPSCILCMPTMQRSFAILP